MSGDYIQIMGVSYKCQLRFRHAHVLDRFARFLYENVLPHEPRVETLINSFGLPRRVMEDILAELLRRNFAVLDVENGLIRQLRKPMPRFN